MKRPAFYKIRHSQSVEFTELHPEYSKEIFQKPWALFRDIYLSAYFSYVRVNLLSEILLAYESLSASERWGQAPASCIHPPIHRRHDAMHACIRACIASVVLIHARMHIYT